MSRPDFDNLAAEDYAERVAERRKEDREGEPDTFGWMARRAADRWERQMSERGSNAVAYLALTAMFTPVVLAILTGHCWWAVVGIFAAVLVLVGYTVAVGGSAMRLDAQAPKVADNDERVTFEQQWGQS